MKILVTGGAGFIGSHLTIQLLNLGHKVLVIDNFATARRDNLKPHENLILIEDTIANKLKVDTLFDDFRPEIVIHAAASYKDPDNWEEDVMTNVYGTVNVVKASLRIGVKRLIYFQTSLCYGLKPLEQPITLKHPLFSGAYSGGSSYAISKTAGEQYIELSGLNFISFRLANAYGPKNLSGPLPIFYSRLTQGKQCFVVDTRRDFIYIDDLIEVVLKAVEGQGECGYYHISSGRDYAIKDLYDAVVDALGLPEELKKQVEVRPRAKDDAPSILIDPSKTEKDFNWRAKTPLFEGIKRAIEYYKVYGVTETFTHLRVEEKK
ncbi:MAG: NAD-dependent epimerase/dehydratase family protein [Candidatus Omnitrophica bacterium]|nr:NAD-dependent epimerase/dehydratase family protein [Candidatus Omnitrophota bacterium]